MFGRVAVFGQGGVASNQETVRISVLLLLVFTQNPPLVDCCGLQLPLTHKETTLQTKHKPAEPGEQREVETVNRKMTHLTISWFVYEAEGVRYSSLL